MTSVGMFHAIFSNFRDNTFICEPAYDKVVMQDELGFMTQNDTWELTNPPHVCKEIKNKGAFKLIGYGDTDWISDRDK